MRIWPSTLLCCCGRCGPSTRPWPPFSHAAARRARPPSRACPACLGPLHLLHTAICMGNLPIAVMQECHQQTWVPPSATGTPGSPDCSMVPHLGIRKAPSIPPWVPVVNFRPVLATNQPRTARPCVQPGPALPCPPAALQLQLPGSGLPFLAGLDGHSLTVCSELQQQQQKWREKGGGRVE